MSPPPPEEQLRFLANLQRLLNEGSFVTQVEARDVLAPLGAGWRQVLWPEGTARGTP